MKGIKLKARFALIFFVFTGKYSAAQNSANTKKTNSILILADNLGFSDLGSYGGEISAPNLDWLANRRLRMNSFYNV